MHVLLILVALLVNLFLNLQVLNLLLFLFLETDHDLVKLLLQRLLLYHVFLLCFFNGSLIPMDNVLTHR